MKRLERGKQRKINESQRPQEAAGFPEGELTPYTGMHGFSGLRCYRGLGDLLLKEVRDADPRIHIGQGLLIQCLHCARCCCICVAYITCNSLHIYKLNINTSFSLGNGPPELGNIPKDS